MCSDRPLNYAKIGKIKMTPFLRTFIAAACAALFVTQLAAAESPREHLSLDAGWKFHLGDDWPNALNLAKAGASSGPAAEKFGDNSWRSLDLPHDWAIEMPFDNSAGTPRLQARRPRLCQEQRRLVSTHAWSCPEDAGKRIWLTFDGCSATPRSGSMAGW